MLDKELILKAEAVLKSQDPVLGKYIQLQGTILHQPRGDYFFSLCRSIVSQQLSVKAAATIFKRLDEATGLQPQKILDLNESQTKIIGLSRQKTNYLKDLAGHFAKNPKIYNHLEDLPDDQVINELTAVKGIGVWTAQMFLMFTLVRLDVFAPDDAGLQRAIKQIYGFSELPSKTELEEFSKRWQPYRTVACWHLWRSLNNEPI